MREGHDAAAACEIADVAEEHLFAAIQRAVLPWATNGETVDLTLPQVDPAALRSPPARVVS